MLSSAAKQGITIITENVTGILQDQHRVIGVSTNSGRQLHAQFVIDGSGKRRLAGKQLKFREEFFSPPLVAWSGLVECNDATTLPRNYASFIPSEKGWTWLAPHTDNCCTWTRLGITHQKKLTAPRELDGYRQVGNIYSANMQWRMFRPLCTEGLLLIGDAVAIIDPAAGQGILTALHSGMYVGRTVVRCMQNPPDESFYLAAFDQWSVNRYMQKVQSLQGLYHHHGINILPFENKPS